jgi:photosystem II stability/assembly factor-like uncharacterized protein
MVGSGAVGQRRRAADFLLPIELRIYSAYNILSGDQTAMERKCAMSNVPLRILTVSLLAAVVFACDNQDGVTPSPPPTPSGRFIAVGVGGTILYSDDGFATCSYPSSGTTEVLRGAAADDQGHCVVVGTNGTFLYSDDRGVTWHTVSSSPTGNTVNRVICYGPSKFMAVGEGSGGPECIFRSTSGGHTWTGYSLSRVFKGIGNRDENGFVAVGFYSSLRYISFTYTGSETTPSWGAGTPSSNMLLYDVVGTDFGYFVAVGLDGSMYSNDGGTWHDGGSVTGYIYAAAWCPQAGRLIGVGAGGGGGVSKGRIYCASFTGASWTEISQPDDTGFLFDVACDNGGQFAAVGAGGEVRYSLSAADDPDAGLSWTEGTSGVAVELYGVAYVAP